MNWTQAFLALLDGKAIKRPSWSGYWVYDRQANNIRMQTKDGNSLLLTETTQPHYTLQNMAAEDWEICGGGELVPVSTLSFSDALRLLKDGKKVARSGWNGKGMWLVLTHSIHEIPRAGTSQPVYRLTLEDEECITALPWIGMKTADNKFVPWLASQTDLLAHDWRLVL